MAIKLLAWLVVLVGAQCSAAAVDDPYALPEGLLLGAGVAAIQTEGAWDEDGKGESAIDHALHSGKLAALGFSNDTHQHEVAADSYHRYAEDVKSAADLGLRLFRFSISWARIMPDGVNTNPLGVQHYHKLIDEILKYNMTPMVTLYHFDHPAVLEKQFNGWQSVKMVNFFRDYARVAFKEYGEKVKLWTTFNEPNMYCSYFPAIFLAAGMYTADDLDQFECLRNIILAHAEAYHVFQEDGHKGRVGFTALLWTARPKTTRVEDVYIADAFNQLTAGVVLHPVVYGDHPQVAKRVLGSSLRPFSETEKQRINGTTDFIGFNVYYGVEASYSLKPDATFAFAFGALMKILPTAEIAVLGVENANTNGMLSLIAPDALRSAVMWAWNEYNLPLLITENGYGDVGSVGEKDHIRGVYHSAYLRTLVSTMKEYNVDVIGYCAWSLIDSYEWSAAFGRPFGLIHVDYEGGTLKRSMKDSSKFWTDMARTRSVPLWEKDDSKSTASSGPAGLTLCLLALVAHLLR